MSFKKIDKFFTLSDSSVNVYGFRLLTTGFLMDEYKPNPIGYYMHGKTDEHPREQGVLVKWEDLQFDGDKLIGKPCINLNHPRGTKTVEEIENGFLNGASVGNIVLLDSHDETIDGEKVLTGTSWYPKEISLVDMPGNRKALAAQLFDKDGTAIDLSDYSHKTKNKMKKIELSITPALIAMLNLSDNPAEKDVTAAIQDLSDTAKKVPGLELQNSQLTTDKEKAVKDLSDLQETTVKKEVKDLLDNNIGKKITKQQAAVLEKQFTTDPKGLKDLMDATPEFSNVNAQIAEKQKQTVNDLADKTWDELDKSDKLKDLKDSNLDLFKEKYKKAFGTDYTG